MNLLKKIISDRPPYLVVFVCTANRARSPYAVARLNAMIYEHAHRMGKLGSPIPIKAIGAGIHTTYGESPLPEVVQLAWDRALDITEHMAVPFDVELERKAGLILTMETKHTELLLRRFSRVKGRVFRLSDYVKNGAGDRAGNIPDPTRRSIEQVRMILDIIDFELARIFPKLLTNAGIALH